MPTPLIHAALAGGAVLISLAIFFWHPGEIASAVAMLYSWVTLYAFYFFRARPALVHAGWIAIAYAVTLHAQHGHQAAVTQWLVTVGTATIAGVLIGRLVHEIQLVSDIDPLTGVANRRSWEKSASAAVDRALRRSGEVAVAMIDLDGFKHVNDAQGHSEGDRLLITAAKAWCSATRPGDLVGRYGGDEFVVLLADCDVEGARHAAERLFAALPGGDCTIGVAAWDGAETLHELVRRADKALYEGKNAGRRRIVVSAVEG